jgi:drug/metabolite transporter (DMT)-like permease
METWLILIILGRLILSFASLIDKYIVTSGKVSKPFMYAFFVSSLSVSPLLLFLSGLLSFEAGLYGIVLPSINNVSAPDLILSVLSLVYGFSFFFSLFYLYSAFAKSDASDVVPVVGSLSAIGVFFLGSIFLGEVLTQNFLIGFVLLVLGTAVVSHFRFSKEVFLFSLLAGIFSAINISTAKYLFSQYTFDNGLFWSIVGVSVVLIIILLIPKYFKEVTHHTRQTKKIGAVWVIGNTILGGTGNFLILKAIDLGTASIVQASGGLQFVFIAILSFIFGRITPYEFGENNTIKDVVQKIFAIMIISLGFFFLFIK